MSNHDISNILRAKPIKEEEYNHQFKMPKNNNLYVNFKKIEEDGC